MRNGGRSTGNSLKALDIVYGCCIQAPGSGPASPNGSRHGSSLFSMGGESESDISLRDLAHQSQNQDSGSRKIGQHVKGVCVCSERDGGAIIAMI